jgi:molecular chaperone GrpE (heat shock protein)
MHAIHFLQRKKDAELKHKVERNKKEFVDKMVPIVEMFRSAPSAVPGETEREQNMHKNFGSLLSSIVTIVEKYGYKDLIAG